MTVGSSPINTGIKAIDWDPAAKYMLTFRIKSGNENGHFSLHDSQKNGAPVFQIPHNDNATFFPSITQPSFEQTPFIPQLVLRTPLDYDNGVRVIRLVIEVSDNGGPDGLEPRINETVLTINVQDSDDLPPVFSRRSYQGTVDGVRF